MTNATHSLQQDQFATDFRKEIDCYDNLPPAVRRKIAYAKFSISSKMCLNLYKALRNEEMVLKAIEQIEQQWESENGLNSIK